MAVLKIYNDIQSENQKAEAVLWGEVEGVSFNDIDAFCESIPADDNVIDIRLHCDGGSVQEGWAIYDRIRATGKEISVTVEGNAASMATVVMMAAPKERRFSYQSAHICVHNPWMNPWGIGNTANADTLQKYADDLRAEQQKMVDLYVERCGCDAETIQSLMDEDKYICAEEAKNLGLIGNIIPPASASKRGQAARQHIKNNNPKSTKMAEDKNVEVKQSFLDKVLHFFGKSSISEICFGMDLNTADGQVLTVEREQGAPQVGDKASPDGEFVMPDGATIIVSNGVITEIRPAQEGDGEGNGAKEGDEGGDGDGAGSGDDKDAKIAELEADIAENEAEIAELKEQLDAATKNAKTTDDLRILNAVKMAGGEKALAKISSAYKPEQRQPTGAHAQQQGTRAEIANAIRDNIKKLHGKKEKK